MPEPGFCFIRFSCLNLGFCVLMLLQFRFVLHSIFLLPFLPSATRFYFSLNIAVVAFWFVWIASFKSQQKQNRVLPFLSVGFSVHQNVPADIPVSNFTQDWYPNSLEQHTACCHVMPQCHALTPSTSAVPNCCLKGQAPYCFISKI